jgi:hypothetical protein
MELHFFKLENGSWDVLIETPQANMPAILNDYIKDAVREAIDKFNKI